MPITSGTSDGPQAIESTAQHLFRRPAHVSGRLTYPALEPDELKSYSLFARRPSPEEVRRAPGSVLCNESGMGPIFAARCWVCGRNRETESPHGRRVNLSIFCRSRARASAAGSTIRVVRSDSPAATILATVAKPTARVVGVKVLPGRGSGACE
ncbi:hypothetical protein [Amycolatopsis sp. NBC_00438]|uniref:hypothetical protein n=1 Tax=Amycolatopsis sp. NBC_00438 TaxID=2903558 RepID=UPI002E1F738F